MQPERRNKGPEQQIRQQPYAKKQKKMLSKNSLIFLNTLLFDEQIQKQKSTLSSCIQSLNKQLLNMSIRECLQTIEKAIDSQQKLRKTILICHQVIRRFLAFEIKSVLLNGQFKQDHKDLFNIRQLQILANKEISFNCLGNFCKAFDVQLDDPLVEDALFALCKNKQYQEAFKIVWMHKNKNKKFVDIIVQFCLEDRNFDDVQYVAGEVVKLGFTKSDYKKLHQKGIQSQMYKIYYEEGFYHAEQVYSYNPVVLKFIANMMARDKRNIKKEDYLSLCSRHPDIVSENPEIAMQISKMKKYIPNPLQNDRFEPSDPKIYLSLSQFGIDEINVFFVNSKSVDLNVYLKEIVQSQVLGLDTQSYVARTKFCTDLELISTIQISNGKRVYVFDAKDIKNPQIGNTLAKFFYDPDKILVGHTIKEDLETTLKTLGIVGKYKCQCVDVKQDFKQLYPGERAGLQNICKVVLGKPICKTYTLTDWGRRPLLKNQLHYAALDAVCVLHVNQRLQQIKNSKKKK